MTVFVSDIFYAIFTIFVVVVNDVVGMKERIRKAVLRRKWRLRQHIL